MDTELPTAVAIDKACQKGLFVFRGNRQQVIGASREYKFRPAGNNKVWINMVSGEWLEVPAREVIITTEPANFKEGEMLKGKREGGRPAHHGSAKKAGKGQSPGVKAKKKAAKAHNNGNLELPGVDVDARKISAIENAEVVRQAASGRLSEAHTELEEATERVVAAMEANGFNGENPIYTRQPFGSVIYLPPKPATKAKVKFVAATAGKSKKSEEDE